MKKYHGLIFDLGNVIFECSFDLAVAHWSACTQISTDELESRIDLEDHYHYQFEKSLIDQDTFRLHLSQQIGSTLSANEFETGWNSIYGPVFEGAVELLTTLTSTYQIVALTNTNAVHRRVWEPKYEEVLSLFDIVFGSDEIKSRKPEKEAYIHCLDYLGMESHNVIFLDDKVENVIGAQRLGMKGIHVSSFPKMISQLQDCGITTKQYK